jgi:hypothetical protein
MSIFSKALSALTMEDLQALLDDRAVENLRLEFKREVASKDETLKKLSAFANTLGGLMVVGAAAQSTDGRITGLPGVDSQPNYKQTLVQWCFAGASPPIDVEVSDPIPSPADASKVCDVISVRESDVGPHCLNGRKGVYVRSDEFSSKFEVQLANDNELRHLLQRRQLVMDRRGELLRRSRQRFDTFTSQKYSELGKGKKEGIGARFDLCVVPRFPSQTLCDHARLLELVSTTRLEWRQVGFPRTTGGGFLSQHESVIGLRPGSSFSILEVNTWGMCYYATEVELSRQEYEGNHVYHFLGQLLVFLKHAGVMLKDLGYQGPLAVDVKLEGFRGVPWIYVAEFNSPTKGPTSELDDGAPSRSIRLRKTLRRSGMRLRWTSFATSSSPRIGRALRTTVQRLRTGSRRAMSSTAGKFRTSYFSSRIAGSVPGICGTMSDPQIAEVFARCARGGRRWRRRHSGSGRS